MKRYNLLLPDDLFGEIQALATDEHISILELLRKLIRIGLKFYLFSRSSSARIILREGEQEREIILL